MQASACRGLLDPTRASCRGDAQHEPEAFVVADSAHAEDDGPARHVGLPALWGSQRIAGAFATVLVAGVGANECTVLFVFGQCW